MTALEGLSIRLRDIRLDDLGAVEYWSAPGQLWMQFDAPYLGPPTPEATTRRLEAIKKRIETGEFSEPRSRLVIADRQTDAYLGEVSWYWESKETRWASVGLHICDPAYWGQGLGYEALGQWCDYLVGAFPDWLRIGCGTWSGNPRMMALARKLGMQQEACYRMARPYNGVTYDSVAYGVLRQEWDALYPAGFAAHLQERAADR